MEGAEIGPPQPGQLTERQIELVRELTLLSAEFDFGRMFAGAIHALHDKSNPDALAQAAHSLRELMEKLEGVKGLPITDKSVVDGAGTLGQKTRQLHGDWQLARAKSKCLRKDAQASEIDEVLRKFLGKIGAFFDWFERSPKFRFHKARGVVKALDPLATMLPQAMQDAQAGEWTALKDYFIQASHHGTKVTPEGMEATVASLERFLYIRVAPVKAQNQAAIERLIREVEG